MERKRLWAFVFPALAVVVSAAQPVAPPADAVKDWPPAAKSTAQLVIGKYGPPTSADQRSLTWNDKGPWKRIVVFREGYSEDPAGRAGLLQQTIAYHVPPYRIADLAGFDSSLLGDYSGEELSFLSDSEGKNFLAINLAHEIITGKRTIDDARDFYEKQVTLMAAGKSSRYTERFLFPVKTEAVRPAP